MLDIGNTIFEITKQENAPICSNDTTASITTFIWGRESSWMYPDVQKDISANETADKMVSMIHED